MKIFANKNIWKKIIIAVILMLSFSFIAPEPVAAGIGGTLMEPICDLLVGLGDGFLNVAHNLLLKQGTTLIRVDLNGALLNIFRIVISVIVFAAVMAAAAALTGGGAVLLGSVYAAATSTAAGAAATVAASAIIANIIPIALTGAYFGAKAYSADVFDNEIDLPLYSISPEGIFSNKIPFFDVNFFNPNAKPFEYKWLQKKQSVSTPTLDQEEYKTTPTDQVEESVINANYTINGKNFTDSKGVEPGNLADSYGEPAGITQDDVLNNGIVGEEREASPELNMKLEKIYYYQKDKYIYKFRIPYVDEEHSGDNMYYLGRTEGTLKRKTNSTSTNKPEKKDEETTTSDEVAYSFSHELQNTVAHWYVILRILATVGMMSVLVYIGIRILISSTAPQKAKYKELLKDWMVGMTLLFTMHYIMYFANMAVDKITEIVSAINPMGQVALIEDKNDAIEKELKEYKIEVVNDQSAIEKNNSKVYKSAPDSDGKKWVEWHTDLMGHMRIALQESKKDNDAYIGYTLMFLIMIFYTISFCFTYTKRVIYMAFLTVIAPLVALTYPIDKVNDGSAQGFNFWFKEYMFNLLLQPMHLLIYTILVSSAIQLATTNWIYSLVALGFISVAEKIVRQMFNFQKAHTPGVFAGPAGAALTMTGMRFLFGHGPKGGGLPKGGSRDSRGGSSDGSDITAAGSPRGLRENMRGLLTRNSKPGEDVQAGNVGLGATVSGNMPGANSKTKTGNSSLGTGMTSGINGGAFSQANSKNSAINSNGKRKNGLKLAIGDSLGMYKDGMKMKFARSIKNAQPIRKMGRMATGAAAAATFGMIGLASGIASGEPKNVLQNTGFAVAGGYKLGTSGYNAIESGLSVDGVAEQFEKSYYGADEYKRIKAQENQAKDKYNEDFIAAVQNKKGGSRKEAQEWIEQNAPKFREERINDINDMLAISGAQGEKFEMLNGDGTTTEKEMDLETAMGAYQLDKVVGGITDREKRIDRIQDIMKIDRESATNLDNARAAFANKRDGIKPEDQRRAQEEINNSIEKANEEQIRAQKEANEEQIKAQKEADEKAQKEAEKQSAKEKKEARKQQHRIKSAELMSRRRQQPKQIQNLTNTELEKNVKTQRQYDKYDLSYLKEFGNNTNNKK